MTRMLCVLLGLRVVVRFHKSHPIGHHAAPHALRLGRTLRITFSEVLHKAVEPQGVQMGWNVEMPLTMASRSPGPPPGYQSMEGC